MREINHDVKIKFIKLFFSGFKKALKFICTGFTARNFCRIPEVN